MMPELGSAKMLRTITLEEHFATPAFMEGPGREFGERFRSANAPSQMAFFIGSSRRSTAGSG